MSQIREEQRRMFSCIDGIKIQQLTNLNTGAVMGAEVLSVLSVGIDPETFFRVLSPELCLILFFDQIDAVKQIKMDTLFFLNLPVRVLGDKECIYRINQLRCCYRNNIVIELQDPHELINADTDYIKNVKQGISALRKKGWRVWLDDLTYITLGSIIKSGIVFDGVKIDKHIMWKCRNKPGYLALLVNLCRILIGDNKKNILVEGIETVCDYNLAKMSGAEWGQGILWPEQKLSFW